MATMTDFPLSIPSSLMADIAALAAREATPINDVLLRAVDDWVSALKEQGYLDERAARAKPSDLGPFLAAVGSDVAIEGDELPEDWPDRR